MINIKRERRKKKIDIFSSSKKIIKKNKFLDKMIELIEESPILSKLRDLYAGRLSIINKNNMEINDNLAILLIAGNLLITSIFVISLALTINLWYILLIIGLTTFFIIHTIITLVINIKLKKIFSQFPIAIQIFTDCYMSSKNIKTALNISFKEMPYEVGSVFEKLSREFSSSHDYKRNLGNFANSLGYTWGHAFKEILLMSYEGGGDISKDLIYLNTLVNDDIQDREQSKSDMASNKLIFLLIMTATLIAFILNVKFLPIAKTLYFYTPTGNFILMSWAVSIALGILMMYLLDNL